MCFDSNEQKEKSSQGQRKLVSSFLRLVWMRHLVVLMYAILMLAVRLCTYWAELKVIVYVGFNSWHAVPLFSAELSISALNDAVLFSSGSQRRRSLSLPVLTLIFPALLPCLVRDSLCTALQTKILWINWSLNAIDTIETWVSGNLTALTERSQPAIRWRVGEVANRMSCGSFRGGHWYLPFRHHDNRYFADWIRLFPGLSKNSENGNSCPKPHKAACMIEAVGRAVSIETEL